MREPYKILQEKIRETLDLDRRIFKEKSFGGRGDQVDMCAKSVAGRIIFKVFFSEKFFQHIWRINKRPEPVSKRRLVTQRLGWLGVELDKEKGGAKDDF